MHKKTKSGTKWDILVRNTRCREKAVERLPNRLYIQCVYPRQREASLIISAQHRRHRVKHLRRNALHTSSQSERHLHLPYREPKRRSSFPLVDRPSLPFSTDPHPIAALSSRQSLSPSTEPTPPEPRHPKRPRQLRCLWLKPLRDRVQANIRDRLPPSPSPERLLRRRHSKRPRSRTNPDAGTRQRRTKMLFGNCKASVHPEIPTWCTGVCRRSARGECY
jgi:hypothetical protein